MSVKIVAQLNRLGKAHVLTAWLRGNSLYGLIEREWVRQLVSTFLESRGYQVLVAADGASAMQAARSHKDEIDLLLTDVVMPKVGGRELAEHLQKTIPNLKVLFLSGYTGGPVLHPSVQESGAAYVQKPFSMRFLARRIREVLDGPSASLVHPKSDAAATM